MRRLLLLLVAVAAAAAVAAGAAGASTWCGAESPSDRTPQAVAGVAVHFVYAYPVDGADRTAEMATTMQTDAETIDAWWRSQDATRTPRFDTYAFTCGAQLDISTVRLTGTAAELTPQPGRAERIVRDLDAAGFGRSDEVTVVYYDGPDDGQGICGQGGGQPDAGGTYGIVFTQACTEVPTAVTAAHEMTHALGAVEPPAPHECPSPDSGHVCDSRIDLMYPRVDGTPLTGRVLDVNHDDYYGAVGVGFDIRGSKWLRHLDQPASHLTLVLQGPGSVASDVPGVQCTVTCGSDWDSGSVLTLAAEPAAGKRFVRWGGSCTGDYSECTLTLTSATTVTALFAPPTYVLTLALKGGGTVLNGSLGSLCRLRCRQAVTSYTTVQLRASARPGWKFKGWTGACKVPKPVCKVSMTAAASTTAVFVKVPKKKR